MKEENLCLEEYLEKYKQIGNEEETIIPVPKETEDINCLLYTSDAADEL